MNKIYNFSPKDIRGNPCSLSTYENKVLLIVNVASKCGFTSQYKEFEELYLKYKGEGIVILGFPCNQFGAQESGSEEEIQEFCTLNFGVTFPLFSKIEVNGDNTEPLYEYLKNEQRGLLGTKAIKWNFTKFLVDKSGKVLKRFASASTPSSFEENIKELL